MLSIFFVYNVDSTYIVQSNSTLTSLHLTTVGFNIRANWSIMKFNGKNFICFRFLR